MEDIEKKYLTERPQHLCKMCGKCCRVVTTSTPYKKLKRMQKEGDAGANDFLDIFVPYSSITAARSVDAQIVDNVIKSLQEEGVTDLSELTFYYCKHLKDNNLCEIYKERKQLCKNFPSSPWAVVPPDCGFENWLFTKREETKQKIRKLKEELLELELLKQKINSPETIAKINLVIKKMTQTIDIHKKHGSDNW